MKNRQEVCLTPRCLASTARKMELPSADMGNTPFGAGMRQDQEFVFRCVTFEMPVRHPRSGMYPLGEKLGTSSEIQGVEGGLGWRHGFGDHQS